jgi:dTDP-4-amino-4,6-dideoxygalactose transaminase
MVRVLESKRWSAIDHSDSQCASFEREFAAYHGVRHAITVTNGTSALMVALKALGVAPGDEVIVPAVTYAATATAASLIGAVPVFVDVDSRSHNILPAGIEAAMSPRTRAIVIVHLHGHPCELDPIMELARSRGIPVVEDCAQAHGATYRGRRVGTFGQVAAFSFAMTKNLTAGEGGAVLTDDEGLAREARALRDHGRPPGQKDDHPKLGWGFRMTEFQGALLRSQLRRLDSQLARKAEGAAYLAEQLGRLGLPWLSGGALPPAHATHGLFCFPFRYDAQLSGVPMLEFARALAAEGIPTGNRHTLALPDLHLFRSKDAGVPSRAMDCSQAREVARTLIRMGQPTGSGLLLERPADLDDVVAAVSKVAENLDALIRAKREGTS